MASKQQVLEKYGIPKRYWDQSLDTLLPEDDDQVAAIELGRVFAAEYPRYFGGSSDFDPSVVGKGILFVGPPGTGKTTLACLTAIEVTRQNLKILRNHPEYPGVRYLTVNKYLDLEIASFNWTPEPDDPFIEVTYPISRPERAGLLVLDDVGKEHRTATKFAEDKLDSLLRERFDAGLPTIITSNQKPEKWREVYGASMFSFLHEAFVIQPLVGEDQRQLRV